MHFHPSAALDPRYPAGFAMTGRGGGPRRGSRRGHGGPPFGFPGFGPPRGPRARNGDGLMQEIEQRSDGVWRPSPGSVYPALQQLEDEGLVEPAGEGRKAYTLTADGRAHVEEHREALGSPWDAVKGDMAEGTRELMDAMRQIGMALFQLTHSGTDEQRAEAREVLAETRRALYRIL